MTPDGPIKLVSQLLDLPLLDKDDRWCGVVDDVEFDGRAGEQVRLKGLLVGPGAYKGRMPAWLFGLVRMLAGSRVSRIPFNQVESIGSAVRLKCAAEKVGLHVVENRLRAWIPRKGAL